MSSGTERGALEQRQSRVSTIVWGALLMTAGVLIFLHNIGKLDLSPNRHAAARAVDGDPGTRWSSEFSDPQWIEVDLGEVAQISRVVLHWESAHATEYRLRASEDRESWTTISDVSEGQGEVETHDVSVSGRYVRMEGVARATPYGYSLWELEVYGTPGSTPAAVTAEPELLSQGCRAIASSREGVSQWWLYWPVFPLAFGLPLLLAPKDPGESVVGVLLSGFAVMMLLRNLELTSWGVKEILPVAIVLAGLVLVVQALNRSGGGSRSDGGDGPADSVF